VAELRQPGEGIQGPDITLDVGEDETIKCQAIDVDTQTFLAIVPRLEELRFLTHCRQVHVGHKELPRMKHMGCFSVVIGSRFPKGDAPQDVQIAHLVSLEGFYDYLPRADGSEKRISAAKVRLVSLASWSFTCVPEMPTSFRQLMCSLLGDSSPGGASLLLRLRAGAAYPEETAAEKVARQAAESGYVPLSYQTLPGDQTFAWYRGPLAPAVADHFTARRAEPFGSAAETMIYDEHTGLFNMAYAVAWQTGRTLALADRIFAVTLLSWRREASRLADLVSARSRWSGLTGLGSPGGAGEDLSQLLAHNLITDTFLGYLVSDFAKGTAQLLGAASGLRTPDHQADTGDRPASNVIQQLQALMKSPGVQKLLTDQSAADKEPQPGDEPGTNFARIVQWLARLYLLEGVPFDNLVPDTRMLPRESIRFFYLDRNWLDSLVDGALSIGIHSSRDRLHYQLTRDALRKAVGDAVPRLRERLLPPQHRPLALDPIGDTMAGFLLRSATVSGWPGLEIRAYRSVVTSDAGATPAGLIKLLRVQRLAPDTLLCLYPEVPAWVELCEPKEGLIFGVERDGGPIGSIALRYVRDDSKWRAGELVNPPAAVMPANRDEARRVLDVAGLLGEIESYKQQIGAPGLIGPADLAIQLVKVPERMVFQHGGNA
jgi:hypothetical protein